MGVIAASANPFIPGGWTLVALALILGLAVWMALRQRRLSAAAAADLPDDAWRTDCLDPAHPGDYRLLVVSDDELIIAHPKSGSREEWSWDKVSAITPRTLRSRMNNYPGVRLSFVDGQSRDLLVMIGHSRRAYADGANAAVARIEARLAHEPER